MKSTKIKLSLSFAVLSLTVWGCTGGSDDSVFSSIGNQQSKPRVTQINDEDRPGLDTKKATELVSATYDIFIFNQTRYSEYQEELKRNPNALPDPLCIGEASAKVMSDFSLGKLGASIDCMGIKVDDINLGDMLGGKNAGSFIPLDKLVAADKMVSSSKIGKVDFAPARPLFIGPIIQDPKEYLGFAREVSSTATHTDPATGKITKANGKFAVNVFSARNSKGEEVVLKKYQRDGDASLKFDKILHWGIAASGYEALPVTETLAFKSIEYYWNTNPIMIPMVVVTGNLGEFIKLNDTVGDVANQLLGEIRIELQVKQYKL